MSIVISKIMKKLILALLLSVTTYSVSIAQLANGTTAPNFTATDINGVNHNLYDLLNQGKTVYIDFFATWCTLCWNYHNTEALKNVWNTYGPPGTNEAYVLSIEAYQPSNTNCIYGPSGCNNSTKGNWTTGVPYPIIDNADIGAMYMVDGYPTIYCICPDKKVYVTGSQNMTGLWNARYASCANTIQVAATTVQDIICSGTSTGAIDITPMGGIPPYTYLWSNGATTQDLANIAAGTYTCTVTGGGPATKTTDPILVNGPPTALSLTQTAATLATCNSTGATVTVNALGGWGSYSYTWSTGQSSATATGLAPGNYTVTASDNRGCTKTLSTTIAPPILPTVNITVPAVITCVQTTVQLNGTGSSSGTGYTYLWTSSNGGNIVGSNTILNPTVNTAAVYTLKVTNSTTACTNTAAATVTTNTIPPVAAAATPSNLNCNTTQLQLNGTGSSVGSNFTYNWTTSNGNIASGQNTLLPIITSAGIYKVCITNTINGCTATATATVVQSPPVTVTVTSQNNINCNGGNNGSAMAAAAGGVGAFSFLWSNGSTAASASGLSAGNYKVTVTDIETCTATATITLAQPPLLTATATATGQTAVGVNNGTATATPSGGTPGYTFIWSNAATTNTINNLAPGTYTVTINDANGCTTVQTVFVNQVNCSITAQLAATNAICSDVNNGTIVTTMLGGAAPFTYNWSNSVTTASVSNLAGGTYTVTVIDMAGCTTLATATIGQPLPIVVSIATTGQTMVGQNNGTASAASNGGTPGYTYLWNNGSSNSSINNLAPGIYTVTVTDTKGCSATKTAIVTGVNCTAVAQTSVTNATCNNVSDGAVMAMVIGGMAPFTYLWNTGSTSQILTGQAIGIYSVTVTDTGGCQAIATATIAAIDIIAPGLTCPNDITVCPNSGAVNFPMPTATDNCSLASNQLQQIGGLPTGSVFPLGTTLQSFRISDASGNMAACSFKVIVTTLVLFDQIQTTPSVNNQSNGSIDITLSGGTAPYTFLWTNSAGQPIGTTEDINNLVAGFYAIKITDLNGCTFFNAIEVKAVTGSTEPTWLSGISIQPNPTNDIARIVFAAPLTEKVRISVTDAGGKIWWTHTSNNQQVDLDCTLFPAGLYWVVFGTADGLGGRKLVVGLH
jgi:hypothetical protein